MNDTTTTTKAYRVTFRYATGYGANLRYIHGTRYNFIVNAESLPDAFKAIDGHPDAPSTRGLLRGYMVSGARYYGGKLAGTTIDTRTQ